MYLRPVHTEQDQDVLAALICEHPLGIFTTALPGSVPLIQSSHIPFVLDVAQEREDTHDDVAPESSATLPAWAIPKHTTTLRGHLARNNPQAKALLAASDGNGNTPIEVQVLFHGPQAYVTPKWYVDTKPTSGKVVPTWNYAAVQVYGTCTVRPDETFLSKQIADLTDHMERSPDGKTTQWKVSDAPDKYIALRSKAIVGVEIHVTHLSGKFKVSQESNGADARGVAAGMDALGTEAARDMAELVRARRPDAE